MLPYFKKYTIICCAVAVIASVVVSTIWPLATGQIMAASLPGLLLLIAVFFGTLLISYRFFSARADAETERLFALYNDQCDPAAFVEQGSAVAQVAEQQATEMSSWYMSYYAQALLDLGEAGRARDIMTRQLEGVEKVKGQAQKAAIVVNMVPLACKLDAGEDALRLIDQGLELIGEAQDMPSTQRRIYLQSQHELVSARAEADPTHLVGLCAAVRMSDEQPMRLRVERAWDEARVRYRSGDVARERECLQFIVQHGNKLALVKPAQTRLAEIDA